MSTIDSIEKSMAQIAILREQVKKLNDARKEELDEIDERYSQQILPLDCELTCLLDEVQKWALENKEILTKSGGTFKLKNGEVLFKKGKPSVQLTTPEDVVVENLLSANLPQFVRTKKTVNKQEILKDKSLIVGIDGIEIRRPVDEVYISTQGQEKNEP